MSGAPRPDPITRPRAGVWLALAAVLTLLASPLLAGRAVAAPAMAMPMAATHSAPCRSCSDPLCAAACALSAQLVMVQAETDPAPPLAATAVDYPDLDVRPAGTTPQPGAPPPR